MSTLRSIRKKIRTEIGVQGIHGYLPGYNSCFVQVLAGGIYDGYGWPANICDTDGPANGN